MPLQILSGTPRWVFVLFFVLIALGPSPLVFAAWLAGVAAAVLSNRALESPAGVHWDEAARALRIWWQRPARTVHSVQST